ncbi:hypothetical protein IT6_05045 [Methylacidiphilum caldifontis]|uniref:hypothetical protein n=1 Tax=Methylacidiphilum caldifontis TaxID=2795386 RepID=UPI001A8DDA0E|nr:hypothetical protein [Methylacidiphilum caldifontis]QSR89633.1 hypothetical protein IT6_05045 [Methylacidiphilum caldifontis]
MAEDFFVAQKWKQVLISELGNIGLGNGASFSAIKEIFRLLGVSPFPSSNAGCND